MADQEADQVAASLDAEVDAASAAEAAEQESSEVEDEGAKESTETVDAELDAATLQTKLQETERQLAQREKDYRNLQSLADRHHNETLERQAKLEAKLELMASQDRRGVSPEQAQREQDEFDKTWRTRLEEKPGDAVEFMRGALAELRAEYQSQLDALKTEFSQRVEAVDPEILARKEQIDKMVGATGMTRAQAKKALDALGIEPTVRQPGKVQPPGRTADAVRRAMSKTKTVEPVALDPMNAEVLRMAGVSAEDARAILQATAEDLAAHRGDE